jgi:penicillin G amidase
MRIVGRILVWALVLVLVLALAFSAWFVWISRRSFPQVAGTVDVPGLAAPVTIVRDANGIPNLYAESPEDLFFAQGFVHAQDRFWQMDFNRHVTAGRISELVGASQLETDRYLRTMGWRRVAEQEWAQATGAARTALQSYADGVNAYIADRSPTQLGLEYLVLRVTGGNRAVEPWTPVDSLAWGKAVAWDLRGNAADELNRVRYAAAVGGQRAAQLYPTFPFDEHPTIVEGGAVVDGSFDADAPAGFGQGAACSGQGCPDPSQARRIEVAEQALLASGPGASARLGLSPLARQTADALEAVSPALAGLARVEATLEALIGPAGKGIGSNSWAVAGARTAGGAPLLANDPHLGPAMPSVWYQIGMHCAEVGPQCPYDFSGMSFPGVPAVLSGHNQRAGWAVTNLGPDVTDFVLERIDDEGYWVDGQRRPFTVREEVIRVAGGPDVPITIRETEHGPLMSDVGEVEQEVAADAPAAQEPAPAGQSYGVSYRWTALQPGRLFEAVVGLASMQDWDDFRAAAAEWDVPAQNLVYADVDGTIGYQTPGRIPIRSGYSGRFPVPGWDSRYDWTGFVPFDALPSLRNPDEGFVVTANNAAIGEEYPFWLTQDWDYGYRADRIRTLLEEATAGSGTVDAARMSAIQLDTYSALAASLVPQIMATTSGLDEQTAGAVALFDGWDFQLGADSPAAAYFGAFWRALLEPLYNDELPPDARADGGDRWWWVTERLWQSPEDPWWDDQRTEARETRDDIVRAALATASQELTDRFGADTADWSWGDMHTLTVVANPFGASGIRPLEWIFNRGPVELPGSGPVVNAVGWDASITCDPALDDTDGDSLDSDDPGCADAPTVQPAYRVSWIPSFRSVIDFANLDRATWVHLTGASGHTWHPNYDDQLALWASGQVLPWAFTRPAVEAAGQDTLTLRPAG